MSQLEIIEEIKKLKTSERFMIVQETIKLIEGELTKKDETQYLPLAEAAKFMRAEYETDAELTAFSILDGEDIHEER